MPREPEQLSLDIELPAAKSARAELSDTSRKMGAAAGELRVWPRVGERIMVRYKMYWDLFGTFLGQEYVPYYDAHRGRVQLDAEQPKISESLKASLPKTMSDVPLSMLRRIKK